MGLFLPVRSDRGQRFTSRYSVLEITKELTLSGLCCLKLYFLKTLIQHNVSACSCWGGVDNILNSFKSLCGAETYARFL